MSDLAIVFCGAFSGGFVGAACGIIGTRAAGAYVVRQTFERMRKAAAAATAAVPDPSSAGDCPAFKLQGVGRGPEQWYYCDRGAEHPGRPHHNGNVGEWTEAPSMKAADVDQAGG